MGNGKKYILKGDTTTHGGTVLTAWGEDCPDTKWTIDGRPVAFVGDLVSCPVCGGVHPILKGPQDPPIDFCGKAPALEEWKTGCGAGLKSRMQSHATHTDEGEAARKAAENAAMAAAFVERMAKRQEQAAAQLRAIMEGSQNSSAQRYKGCFMLCDKITDEPLTGFAYGISHRSGEHCDTVYDDGLTTKAYSEEAIDVALRFVMQTEIGIR